MVKTQEQSINGFKSLSDLRTASLTVPQQQLRGSGGARQRRRQEEVEVLGQMRLLGRKEV